MQLMTTALGGKVEAQFQNREYGKSWYSITNAQAPLFKV